MEGLDRPDQLGHVELRGETLREGERALGLEGAKVPATWHQGWWGEEGMPRGTKGGGVRRAWPRRVAKGGIEGGADVRFGLLNGHRIDEATKGGEVGGQAPVGKVVLLGAHAQLESLPKLEARRRLIELLLKSEVIGVYLEGREGGGG